MPFNASLEDVKNRIDELLGLCTKHLEFVTIVEGNANPVAWWRGRELLAKNERVCTSLSLKSRIPIIGFFFLPLLSFLIVTFTAV